MVIAVRTSKILLVEDDVDHAAILGRWLERIGAEVVTTGNGRHGDELARSAQFDAVISDVMLPEGSGLDIVATSKRLYPWRPTILITAHGSFDSALSALRSGVDEMLPKPIGVDGFLKTVKTLVDRGRADRARQPRVVVAIGAHPDDVEIGCGGVLLRHRQQGDRVVLLTLTRGAVGGNADERSSESRAAVKLLDADLALGDLRDTEVSGGASTIQIIENILRSVQPGVVYTHTDKDTHQDHRGAHEATLVAARAVPNLFCYQSPSSTPDFRPSLFVNIDAHLSQKEALIACYATQTATRPYLNPELMRATARYWGRYAGYGHVEALEIIRAVE